MTYRFVISSDPKTGADVARCGEHTARSSRASAAHDLARAIIGAGLPDAPIEARGEDGRLRYTVRSLAAFARWTITETPKLRRMRWTAFDVSRFRQVPDAEGPPPGEHLSAETGDCAESAP